MVKGGKDRRMTPLQVVSLSVDLICWNWIFPNGPFDF
jgi:hypothetical protein